MLIVATFVLGFVVTWFVNAGGWGCWCLVFVCYLIDRGLLCYGSVCYADACCDWCCLVFM